LLSSKVTLVGSVRISSWRDILWVGSRTGSTHALATNNLQVSLDNGPCPWCNPPGRFGGHRVCDNKPVSRDALDQAVWDDVRSLLANPKRIEEELDRRMNRDEDPEKTHGKKLKLQIGKVNRGISRLVDAYTEGFLEKSDFEPRIKSAKAQLSQLQDELQSQVDLASRARELRGIIDHLRAFSRQVMSGLDVADWETKRKTIQTLIKKIEIGKERINVIYRVDLFPSDPSPSRDIYRYCRTSGRSFPARTKASDGPMVHVFLTISPAMRRDVQSPHALAPPPAFHVIARPIAGGMAAQLSFCRRDRDHRAGRKFRADQPSGPPAGLLAFAALDRVEKISRRCVQLAARGRRLGRRVERGRPRPFPPHLLARRRHLCRPADSLCRYLVLVHVTSRRHLAGTVLYRADPQGVANARRQVLPGLRV
jgi:hypothetical protein